MDKCLLIRLLINWTRVERGRWKTAKILFFFLTIIAIFEPETQAHPRGRAGAQRSQHNRRHGLGAYLQTSSLQHEGCDGDRQLCTSRLLSYLPPSVDESGEKCVRHQ